MSVLPSAETLLPRHAEAGTRAGGLSPELLAQSARRLRILALQYAFIFFMSDPLLAILFREDRQVFLSSALRWAPSCLSIAMALLVVGLTLRRRIAPTRSGIVSPGWSPAHGQR
jgi:hypothetical protein